MDGEGRRERVSSFLLGGLLGASAVVAAGVRRRQRAARRAPPGLAAFEEAPCYQELLEGETSTASARRAEREPSEPS